MFTTLILEHTIIVSSPLGDSEISGTIQHVLFCQVPAPADWEEAEWNEELHDTFI